MADNWSPALLRDHVDILLGFAFKSAQFRKTPPGIRLARGDNVTEGHTRWGEKTRYWPRLTEDLNRYLLRSGDVLVGMDGSKVGRNWTQVRSDDLPCLLVQRVACLRARETLDQGFLAALIASQSFKDHVNAIRTGSSIPHISGGQIGEFGFLLPPLSEQRVIASILGAMDGKIELNRGMNETLEALARAIFKSWFVDFDPVRAKAEGRQPCGMNASTAALFPDSFQDSALGKIPRGWRIGTVRDCCERIENGGTPKRDESRFWLPGTIPWLTSSEVRENLVIYTNQRISEEGYSNSNTRLWPNATTVVALYGATAGEVCLLAREMCANQACCGLIPLAHMRYFNFLSISSCKDDFRRLARGSAQQNISQEIVANLPTTIPDTSLCSCFDVLVAPFFQRAVSNLLESRTLADVRDALLPKLIAGEIRVRQSENVIEEHV